MRRALVALGAVFALSGALMCWPLARAWFTHERGQARILELYRLPGPSDAVALRAVWELQTGPGRWLIGDAQSDLLFRPGPDPEAAPEEAAAVAARLLPDREGRQRSVPAFWRANDPAGTAFIIDITNAHWWQRYLGGVALCWAGLLLMRLAWPNRRQRQQEYMP